MTTMCCNNVTMPFCFEKHNYIILVIFILSFFMDKRIAEGLEYDVDIEFKVPKQKRVQRQIDQHNCGVLTLKVNNKLFILFAA